MPRVFRVMLEVEGRPAIGDRATMLGVRVPEDIEPDDDGNVCPDLGGMSVSPNLKSLPSFRIPRRLNKIVPAATGNNSHYVWSMGEGPFVESNVNTQLKLR